MRILAVDDDPIILELIREIIGLSDDQELLTAGSGPEALKLLDDPATPMIDCFLLDIQMPVMDGIDLCTALRKRPEFRTTPVVMLTAMTEKRYVDAAFIAGATDYITKPFDIGDMQRRLRTAALRRSAMARFETDASAAVAQGQRRELLAEVPIELWWQDEARVGQKNPITRRWARRGTRPRAPRDQRTKWAYIFGAICPAKGKAAGLVMPFADTEAMQAHLAEISLAVDPGAHAVLMLDQAGWHMSARLAVPDNITLLPLPPRSPELNPVENVWQFMRDNWLSNRVFRS